MTVLHPTKLSFTNTKTLIQGVRYHPSGAEEVAQISDAGSDKDLEVAASKLIPVLIKYNLLSDDWLESEITTIVFKREAETLTSIVIAAKLYVVDAEPTYAANAVTPAIGVTWLTPQEDLLVNALLREIDRYVDAIPKQQSLEFSAV